MATNRTTIIRGPGAVKYDTVTNETTVVIRP